MSKINIEPGQAMEYVLGTLSAEERTEFEKALLDSRALREEVAYWEEQLNTLNENQEERPPSPEVWEGISQTIAPKETKKNAHWMLRWLMPSFAAVFSVLLLIGFIRQTPQSEFPNADYLAVLTNTEDRPVLTALTTVDASTLWLQWEKVDIAEETNLQIWAVSRRDGQIRSIAVIDSTQQQQLALNEAAVRLIKDADTLLLTQEEVGGSAIDEPSEDLLAQGVCVRLKNNNAI